MSQVLFTVKAVPSSEGLIFSNEASLKEEKRKAAPRQTLQTGVAFKACAI